MTNRQILVSYLKETNHLIKADPFQNTKNFLRAYNISYKDFFNWLIEEVKPYNYEINSDENIITFLQ